MVIESLCLLPNISYMRKKVYQDGMDKAAIGLIRGFQCMIDQNPENGCEIQNSACGRIGVMLRIRTVKTTEEHKTEHENVGDDRLLLVT